MFCKKKITALLTLFFIILLLGCIDKSLSREPSKAVEIHENFSNDFSVKPTRVVHKVKVSELTQIQIREFSNSNPCYLPLLKDSLLYPDSKRIVFLPEELINDSLPEDNPFKNRYVVGDFMVLDDSLNVRGIQEVNPLASNLSDFNNLDSTALLLMELAVDNEDKEIEFKEYVRAAYSADLSAELINFFDKVWRYKTPGIKSTFGYVDSIAYAMGQRICLCEAREDTLLMISQFAVSSKRLGAREIKDSANQVIRTAYYQHLPVAKSRKYYAAEYRITSKNWETRRIYDELDELHDRKLGGGNNRVTYFKTGAQLPNFLLMTPSKEYPNAMRQNGIHEVALRGLSRGMLGAANSIGCIRVSNFSSKFVRWWIPQNAKFFILYDENRYFYSSKSEHSKSRSPFKNEEEGNEFRAWLNKYKPLRAKQLNIDLEGKHDNDYIIEAYSLFGEDYKKFKSN